MYVFKSTFILAQWLVLHHAHSQFESMLSFLVFSDCSRYDTRRADQCTLHSELESMALWCVWCTTLCHCILVKWCQWCDTSGHGSWNSEPVPVTRVHWPLLQYCLHGEAVAWTKYRWLLNGQVRGVPHVLRNHHKTLEKHDITFQRDGELLLCMEREKSGNQGICHAFCLSGLVGSRWNWTAAWDKQCRPVFGSLHLYQENV